MGRQVPSVSPSRLDGELPPRDALQRRKALINDSLPDNPRLLGRELGSSRSIACQGEPVCENVQRMILVPPNPYDFQNTTRYKFPDRKNVLVPDTLGGDRAVTLDDIDGVETVHEQDGFVAALRPR